jgi:hypothetical protein
MGVHAFEDAIKEADGLDDVWTFVQHYALGPAHRGVGDFGARGIALFGHSSNICVAHITGTWAASESQKIPLAPWPLLSGPGTIASILLLTSLANNDPRRLAALGATIFLRDRRSSLGCRPRRSPGFLIHGQEVLFPGCREPALFSLVS